jgi:hypothetical protein
MSPAVDSAGQPFAGRSFTPNPFSADSGEADGVLAKALATFHSLESNPVGGASMSLRARAWVAVVDALRHARLLSPLIAQAGDYGLTADGKTVEKTQELSVPHLQGPDGRAVSPVFSDVAAMTAWNSQARPIPVAGQRAALAAASDGLDLMVVDPGAAHSVVLRRSAIRAIATGEDYEPPWVSAILADAVAAGLAAGGAHVVRHRILPGDPEQVLAGPEVLVALGVTPGLDDVSLRSVIEEVTHAWASDPRISHECDGLGVKVLPA